MEGNASLSLCLAYNITLLLSVKPHHAEKYEVWAASSLLKHLFIFKGLNCFLLT